MLCFPGNHVEEPRGRKPLWHIAPCPFSCMSPSRFPLFPALHSALSLNHLRLSPFTTSKLWRHRKLIYPKYSSWKHPASLTHNSNFHTRHMLLIWAAQIQKFWISLISSHLLSWTGKLPVDQPGHGKHYRKSTPTSYSCESLTLLPRRAKGNGCSLNGSWPTKSSCAFWALC